MKKFIVKLSGAYEIPQNIIDITSEEWEIILSYLSDLLLKHDSIRNHLNTEDLKTAIANKYESIVKTLKSQLTDIQSKYNALSLENITIKTENNSVLIDKINKQREQFEKEYEKNIEIEKKRIVKEYENIIEDNRKRMKELENESVKLANKIKQETRQEVAKEFAIDKKLLEKELENKSKIEIQYKEQIDILKSCVEDLKSKHSQTESTNKLLDQMNETITKSLEPVRKYYGGTNAEKGKAGEEAITNFLTEDNRYKDGIINVTSKEAESADIQFFWRHLRCIIEVKNKNKIYPEDITKFERDIRKNIEEKEINCAIFVSLCTDIYPGKNRDPIQMYIVDNIPAIYIYANDRSHVHYAIMCLEKIVSKNVSNTKQVEKLLNYFKDYYNHITELKKYFEVAISDNEKENRKLHRQLNMYSSLLTSFASDYIELSPLFNTSDPNNPHDPNDLNRNTNTQDSISEDANEELSEDDTEEPSDVKIDFTNIPEAKETMKQIVVKRRLLKTPKPITIKALCADLNIKPSIFDKLGGYKSLVAEAKEDFAKTIITKEIIDKITNHKSAYNKYPTRIIADNMIGKRQIDKLGKVICSKPLDYIFKYYEAHKDDLVEDTASETDEDDNEAEEIEDTENETIANEHDEPKPTTNKLSIRTMS